MKRQISLDEFTDGRLYQANDMVKLGCNDCAGCSACCCDMEACVIDPYDINQLHKGLGVGLEQLLDKAIVLERIDGILMPVMQTSGKEKRCSFLDKDGRCSIHSIRPGICRLFPLGRYYHGDRFSYVLQVYECQKANRSKVKIKNWLGIPELHKYETFIVRWHHFLLEIQEELPTLTEEYNRVLQMYLLKNFYQKSYAEDFYGDFEARLMQARKDLGLKESF